MIYGWLATLIGLATGILGVTEAITPGQGTAGIVVTLLLFSCYVRAMNKRARQDAR